MKKRLMMISYDMPPNGFWGVASHVALLVRHIEKHYHIDLVSRNHGEESKFITIRSKPDADMDFIESVYQKSESYIDFEYLMVWNHLLARKVIKERENKNRPDIIHNHTWMTFPAAKAISEYFCVPIISSAHFLEKQYSDRENCPTSVDMQDILLIEEDIFAKSSGIISFGKKHKRFILNNYRCDESKIAIIPHGIELPKNKPIHDTKEGKISVSFVGRLVAEKGVLEVVDTVNKLRKDYPNLILHIAGKGQLKEDIKKYHNRNFIRYHGFLTKRDLVTFYRMSDIFCFPSHTETFGLAPVEAASQGVPVIMSRGEAIEDLFKKREALFVDVTSSNGRREVNTEQLYRSLELLVGNASLRAKYSERIFKAARRYDVNKMIKRMVNLYSSLM